MSKPVKGDKWVPPKNGPFVLEPMANTKYPYPIEIDLPPWTIKTDNDFRKWLFGFGSGITIQEPRFLINEIKNYVKRIGKLYKN